MSGFMALLFSKVGAILAAGVAIAAGLFAARQSGKRAEKAKQTEEDLEDMEQIIDAVKENQKARADDSPDPKQRLRDQSKDH